METLSPAREMADAFMAEKGQKGGQNFRTKHANSNYYIFILFHAFYKNVPALLDSANNPFSSFITILLCLWTFCINSNTSHTH